MLASPGNVVEVAKVCPTVVALFADVVVNSRKFRLVVSSTAPGNVKEALVFLRKSFGACFSNSEVYLPKTFVEVLEVGSSTLAASFRRRCSKDR